jgi:hypothetical protein
MSRTNTWPLALAAVCVGLAAPLAQAADNLLINGSFEQGGFVGGAYGYPQAMQLVNGQTTIEGWTVGGELAWFKTGMADLTAADGLHAIDLTGFCDLTYNGNGYCGGHVAPGGYGSISQTIATEAGATYRLSFQGGTYTYQDRADYVHPMLVASAGGASQGFQLPSGAPTTGSWTAYSLDFTATGASTIIGFGGSGGQYGHTYYLGVDQASVELLSAPVPEPQRWALMLAGVAALGAMAHRRRA